MAIKELSILIPTYNDRCVTLVSSLRQQAEALGIVYEILVADDGSDDSAVVSYNETINQWEHCRYLVQPVNQGRAAIRNVLAREARFDTLLFLDSDTMITNDRFLARYLQIGAEPVVVGGITIEGDPVILRHNLRYRYEKAEEQHHTAAMRQHSPYQHIRTTNLLIRHEVMLQHPFDERFRYYGYEDVLLGKVLRQAQVPIVHIDNPIGFCTFESNPNFVAKTEESLRTLHQFRADLRGYSRLLTFVGGIHIPAILALIRLWHRLFGKAEKWNLCGPHPSLFIFKLYRLGYFLSLRQHNKKSAS